jgi:hypothetical protein
MPGAMPGFGHCHNPVASLRYNTMTQRIATYVIVIAAFMGIGTQISIHQLDKATAHQCINHEWPVEAHDIHLAWCAANNYPTN